MLFLWLTPSPPSHLSPGSNVFLSETSLFKIIAHLPHTFLRLLFLLCFSPGHLSSSLLLWDSHIMYIVCFCPYLTGQWGIGVVACSHHWDSGKEDRLSECVECDLLILFLFLNGFLLVLLSIWRSFLNKESIPLWVVYILSFFSQSSLVFIVCFLCRNVWFLCH